MKKLIFLLLLVVGVSAETEKALNAVNVAKIADLEERALINYLLEHKYLSVDQIPDRIIGGVDADETDAPFQIALHRTFFSFIKRFMCGGSLISPRTVLSAGHCVIQSASYAVRYGTNNRLTSPFADLSVSKVILHPQFNLSTVQNDLALFILKSAVQPSNNVRSIDLQSGEVSANTTVTLYGFGLTNGLGSVPARKLQKTNLNILSESTCKRYIESLGVAKHPGMLCAQADQVSACNGDSGGPLVGTESRRQVGIVSFGTRFCPPGSINVYTNVSHYVSWINENLVA